MSTSHPTPLHQTAEFLRLQEEAKREKNWKRWGPYLAERQWGTVREDYSEDGNCWEYFPHAQARSRAYRWGEDGLLGWTDRQCRICFCLALWNMHDPYLKERLFGLTNPEGNHSEDVKECYYYLRGTPTHSYQKGLYKYPHLRFPYEELLEKNAKRTSQEPEFELIDTGIFEHNDYTDVFVEYAKACEDDVLIEITLANRSQREVEIDLLPQIWFRNVWSFGSFHHSVPTNTPPRLWQEGESAIFLAHETLESMVLEFDLSSEFQEFLFTENSTNYRKIFDAENHDKFVKDAFHDYLIDGSKEAVSNEPNGTKAAGHFHLKLSPGDEKKVRLRLRLAANSKQPAFDDFDQVMMMRRNECDEFYSALLSKMNEEDREISLQAYAGLTWSKQFYNYGVGFWVRGDPEHPLPPHIAGRRRNQEWQHLFARDIISVPDKWEYPWFAAWDLAFHMVPYAKIDPWFAKGQIEMLLREWYLHPNGQIPAYEFHFGDVNPPVQAWAAWRVYEIDKSATGKGDRAFLAGVFHKLLMNFTWWVNQKDRSGNGIFTGGFLGLDNIGVLDRGAPLPGGGQLEQADATSWMAFYCLYMLRISLELSLKSGEIQRPYQDMATKFWNHFMQISEAMNSLGGSGLWHEQDGFYYDHLGIGDESIALKTRSLVGLLPLIAVEVLTEEELNTFPVFKQRFEWYRKFRPDLTKHLEYSDGKWLLSLVTKSRLTRVLRRFFDENEFLSDYGIRSLSKAHQDEPYELKVNGSSFKIAYTPGESDTEMFGGNSNWRGPVWFPINHLLIEALDRFHDFYGSTYLVGYPSHKGELHSLREVSLDLRQRHAALFRIGKDRQRPAHGKDSRYANDSHWRDLVLFYEYFHGEDGKGLGASHQTGWTALVATHLEEIASQ